MESEENKILSSLAIKILKQTKILLESEDLTGETESLVNDINEFLVPQNNNLERFLASSRGKRLKKGDSVFQHHMWKYGKVYGKFPDNVIPRMELLYYISELLQKPGVSLTKKKDIDFLQYLEKILGWSHKNHLVEFIKNTKDNFPSLSGDNNLARALEAYAKRKKKLKRKPPVVPPAPLVFPPTPLPPLASAPG